jgi:hypothetical protein
MQRIDVSSRIEAREEETACHVVPPWAHIVFKRWCSTLTALS